MNEVTHTAWNDNSKCDRLSRRELDGPSTSVVQMTGEMRIGGTRVVEPGTQEAVMDILRMCNPKIVLTQSQTS